MIEVVGLVRRYGDVVAVDGLDLAVADGEVVGLLGPNGAGKTTTLRILCGCLGPTAGTVRIAGHDLAREGRAARAALGYLPELPPLYEQMTVEAFIDHAARLRRVPASSRREAVADALHRTDLEGVRRRLIAHLSKGFRQRVGLAQALVHRPRVLVLDEPTSGLDPAQMASMRSLIHELRGQATILLSTHLLSEATSLCDRVAILAGGRLVATGTEDELRDTLLDRRRVRLAITGDVGACAVRLRSRAEVADVTVGGAELIVTLADASPETLAGLNATASSFGLLRSGPADGLEELFLRAVSS